MNRDEAVARIAQGLSFRTGQSENIKQRLEEARVNLEMGKTLPWFLLVEDAELTLAAGANTIALPEGFIRHAKFERLRYTPVDSDSPLVVPWKSLDDAIATYGDLESGGPVVAVLRKDEIRVFPTADTEYTLLWSYYKHSDALDGANIDTNAWLLNCPDVLIGEAGWRLAADLKDQAAMQKFEIIRATGKAAYLGEEFTREADDGPLIMGANN